MPDGMSEWICIYIYIPMPERMPERMPDRMPDRMPESPSDRLSVGRDRSKKV